MTRVPIHAWGVRPVSLPLPAYALRQPDETAIEAALRAIARRTGLCVCACSSQGTALRHGRPEAHHYQITLGRYNRRAHAYDVRGGLWLAVPVDGR